MSLSRPSSALPSQRASSAALLSPRPARPATAQLAGGGLVTAGLGLAVTAVVAERSGAPFPAPGAPLAVTAAAVTAVALVLVGSGAARLGRLDRHAVSSGTGLFVATQVAVTMIDPTILTGVLEERRWRRIGRVRSRPFAGAGPVALLRADLRRVVPHPMGAPGRTRPAGRPLRGGRRCPRPWYRQRPPLQVHQRENAVAASQGPAQRRRAPRTSSPADTPPDCARCP